ncbi:MAG: glycosyltransferase family 4 protein [Chloroflexi bacterium]|nr:glycosyltransferase family 4 protein [Chloroflexota bacterium]
MSEAPLRIAMIGPFGLGPKATVRERALPLARALAAHGHRVAIYMPPWHTPAEAGRTWEEDGVRLEYVSLGPGMPLVRHGAIARRLAGRAMGWRPDVIHAFKPKAHAGMAAALLWARGRLRRGGVPVVVDEDDWEGPGGWKDLEPYPRAARALFARQEGWGLRHADGVTVASRALETLVWGLGVPPERVHYLPNGAPSPAPGDGEGVRLRLGLGRAPVILLYTRFFEYDVARVVEALERVVGQAPEARLLVVGEGLYPADEERFYRLVAEAGLSGAVCKAGWVPLAELPDHFAAADLAIYPYDDTLVNRTKCSVKLAGLLAAGVPVVAEAVGQNAEYIRDGHTGLLATGGGGAALARRCLALLGDADLRARLGRAAAREMATTYSWDHLAERLLTVYASARGASLPPTP